VKPRVYYIGLPKRFIGGTIYDPEADEVIIGADIDIIKSSNGESKSFKTDEFGDFWVDNLLPENYTVVIKNQGYLTKELEADITALDVNLGDIPLYRENK